MKIITLEKDTFDHFAESHKYRSFYQSSYYGDLMTHFGFQAHYMGFLDNNGKLMGATLFLYKEIFMGYKYAYAPNGLLIDYTNANLVKELTERLKKLLLKQKYIYIKIDPKIECSTRNKKGEIISYNKDINNILEILKENNYLHHGFNQYFENTKPRWNAIVPLKMTNEKLWNNFDKQIRNKIRKAEKKGIEVYQGTNNDIEIFYEHIKKKHNRPLQYYQKLASIFKEGTVEFHFAKINPEQYVINSKNLLEQEEENNDKLNKEIQTKKGKDVRTILNKKMESDKIMNLYKQELIQATKMLQTHPKGFVIASMCTIKHGKTVYLLIDGYNTKYKDFDASYLLKWEMIKKYNKQGYDYFNLNAVTGDFKKENNRYQGLDESKLGFHAEVVEYIGEFDYIINKPIYALTQIKPIKKNIAKKAE